MENSNLYQIIGYYKGIAETCEDNRISKEIIKNTVKLEKLVAHVEQLLKGDVVL